MNDLTKYLQGGDLRSIGKVERIIGLVNSQLNFNKLFSYLYSTDRLIVMRAVDAIEKITVTNSQYLKVHKDELIKFLQSAQDKEFKWHLALLISRLDLGESELTLVWSKLMEWVKDESESRIVRVNSLQSLFDLSRRHEKLENDFDVVIQALKSENISSLNARIKKLMRV